MRSLSLSHETIQNPWIEQKKIPLGLTTRTSANIYKPLLEVSDSVIISGMPGTGKSVIGRNLAWFISQVRPIIVFDWEGEDHKLSNRANKGVDNLPPFTRASPVRKSVYFNYTKNADAHERKISPDISKCNYNELRSLGFALGASMKLREIMDVYGPFDSIAEIFEFVKGFPTTEKDSIRAWEKRDARKKRNYKKHEQVPTQTKQSLLVHLYRVMEKDLFQTHDKDYPDIIKLLSRGYNVFLNFSGEIDVARVELTRIYDSILKYRKENKDGVCPYIFIEEGDRLVPAKIIDREEKVKTEYVLLKFIESYKRARKHRLGQCFLTPRLSSLHRDVIDLSYEKIYGPMYGQDLIEVKRSAGEYVHDLVKRLNFDRHKNIREFVYLNERKKSFVFIPYACPQLMHKEQ